MPLHVSSTRAHRQEAKIVLYNLWYHHTETSEWSKLAKITKYIEMHGQQNIKICDVLSTTQFTKHRALRQCKYLNGKVVKENGGHLLFSNIWFN